MNLEKKAFLMSLLKTYGDASFDCDEIRYRLSKSIYDKLKENKKIKYDYENALIVEALNLLFSNEEQDEYVKAYAYTLLGELEQTKKIK
jgi:hypothetical protein